MMSLAKDLHPNGISLSKVRPHSLVPAMTRRGVGRPVLATSLLLSPATRGCRVQVGRVSSQQPGPVVCTWDFSRGLPGPEEA